MDSLEALVKRHIKEFSDFQSILRTDLENREKKLFIV